MTREAEMMQRVVSICGPLFDAVAGSTHPATSIPKSFVMALTANETGEWIIDNPQVPSRFELRVFRRLLDLQAGRGYHIGGITREEVRLFSAESLRDYATSWSLTQIMGYNVLIWPGWDLSEIQDPTRHYRATLKLLAGFCEEYGLDPTKDFVDLFTCWNAGSPHGRTFDSAYAMNGIDRMQLCG